MDQLISEIGTARESVAIQQTASFAELDNLFDTLRLERELLPFG